MTRALVALALLVPAAVPGPPPPRQICLTAPPRTTPHRHFERIDKWQNDERTIA